jgi:hypothetical protein
MTHQEQRDDEIKALQKRINGHPVIDEENPITWNEFNELLETLNKNNTAPPSTSNTHDVFKMQRCKTTGKLYLLPKK